MQRRRQRIQRTARLGREHRAPGQHDARGAALRDDLARELKTDAAGAAGDQVATAFLERHRHCGLHVAFGRLSQHAPAQDFAAQAVGVTHMANGRAARRIGAGFVLHELPQFGSADIGRHPDHARDQGRRFLHRRPEHGVEAGSHCLIGGRFIRSVLIGNRRTADDHQRANALRPRQHRLDRRERLQRRVGEDPIRADIRGRRKRLDLRVHIRRLQRRDHCRCDAPDEDPVWALPAHGLCQNRRRRCGGPFGRREQHTLRGLGHLPFQGFDPHQRFGLREAAFGDRAIDGQQRILHDDNPSSTASSADTSFLEMLSSSSR